MANRGSARVLDLLKSSRDVSAAFIGRRLGMTEVGARQHLNRLRQKGLVECQDLPGAVGRPKRIWFLTPKAENDYPDRHADLALEMLRGVREAFGNFGIEGVIAARELDALGRYQEALAGAATLKDRIERLAQLRTGEGYVAETREEKPGVFVLVEGHCPIRAAASQCQAICRSELDLFGKVLGGAAKVERVEHVLSGQRRCAYRITSSDGGGDS